MVHDLKYIGGGLDRASALRGDDAWMAAQTGGAAGPVLEQATDCILLGLDGDATYIAADISELDEAAAVSLVGAGEFFDLRLMGGQMAVPEAKLMAYARGMAHWHQRHQFCGVCGAATESREGGHLRVCANTDGDSHETYPRTDPAVIMLVTRDDPDTGAPSCLMGRQSRWAPGQYSTLAGFVEPGESLEEAVAREVFEEAGIRITDVRYRASQPWPFPSSLMLGFWARAETHDITVDGEELEDAQWFLAEQLRSFGEWGQSEDGSPCLPRRDSISRWLIETWLEEVGA